MKHNDSTPTNAAKYSHQHLVSDESKTLLEEHNLTLDISKTSHCYPILLPFRFAAVPSVFPRFKEDGYKAAQVDYQEIKDCELKDSVEGTAAAVLARLKLDPTTISYWAVYLHELDKPNKNGLSKMYVLDSNGLPKDKVRLAGFAYRRKNGISPYHEQKDKAEGRQTRSEKLSSMSAKQLEVWEGNWRQSVTKALKIALTPINLSINGKFLTLTYYDACDNSFILVDEFCKAEIESVNRRIKLNAVVAATNHRIGLNSYDLEEYRAARQAAAKADFVSS